MDRPLRLVVSNPVDELARTIEALLVVASSPLSEQELAEATGDGLERVAAALELLAERFREGRWGRGARPDRAARMHRDASSRGVRLGRQDAVRWGRAGWGARTFPRGSGLASPDGRPARADRWIRA